jgi:hypothetical protein
MGIVGIYRGRRDETAYQPRRWARSCPRGSGNREAPDTGPGEFYTLLPPADDIHHVQPYPDGRLSHHLLANDTAHLRHRFDLASGAVTPFRSGANAPCPPDQSQDQSG